MENARIVPLLEELKELLLTDKSLQKFVLINGVYWRTENFELKYCKHFTFDEALSLNLPAGFRLPTLQEQKSLLDESKVSRTWTTVNGVAGMKFTDKK
jgi:hypothetical protein